MTSAEPFPAPGAARSQAVPLYAIAGALWARRSLIAAVVLSGVVAVTAFSLLRPARYTVSASFSPQTKRVSSSLAGVAAQFGVSVGGLDNIEQSPAFYVDLVSTGRILGAVADSMSGSGASGQSLADALGVHERTARRQHDELVKKLRSVVSAAFSQRTGVVAVSATLRSPQLAFEVVTRILDEIGRFNLSSRQSQASSERRFTEARMIDARNELSAAEMRTQGFLESNRQYTSSPQLVFQYDRLNREVMLRQQLYNSLAQAYDQAKIDEVRDTPVVTTIEAPQYPSEADPRGLFRWLLITSVVLLVLASCAALALDYAASNERLR